MTSDILYPLVRRALFTAPPEVAHDLALEALKLGHCFGLGQLLALPPQRLPVTVMGLDFPNPVGLAAGLDKSGDYIESLGALGFGFIEVGTVTPRPQTGNLRPRMFRLPDSEALINRLGFNNKGVDHLVSQVEKADYDCVLGINISKNNDTPTHRAVEDYRYCLDKVYPHADYITINISSPNNRGLRDLQGVALLDDFLASLETRRMQLADQTGKRVPMAVKIAPDLDPGDIPQIAGILAKHKVDAVIAGNTTTGREGVEYSTHALEQGGLSGAPLLKKANATLAAFRKALPPSLPLIGTGGICKPDNAVEKFSLGAELVQIYTGFVYHGPGLIADCVRALSGRKASL